MARKNGLNRKEQIQCAKWLTEKVPAKDIAKKFGTSVAIVKKFTQENLDKAAKEAKERMISQNKATQKVKATAEVLKETLDQTQKDADFK